MEEILASIRRILNDDDVPAEAEEIPSASPKDDDILILDESMIVSAVEPASHPMSEPLALPPPVEPLHQEQEKVVVPPTPRVESQEPTKLTHDLLAPAAAAAAASSVGSLVRTLAAGRATQVYGGGPTLEDMVRAELRPLLKSWLDENLPPLVERLVRAEIERVVGREVP